VFVREEKNMIKLIPKNTPIRPVAILFGIQPFTVFRKVDEKQWLGIIIDRGERYNRLPTTTMDWFTQRKYCEDLDDMFIGFSYIRLPNAPLLGYDYVYTGFIVHNGLMTHV
jgi:hypothetical protein